MEILIYAPYPEGIFPPYPSLSSSSPLLSLSVSISRAHRLVFLHSPRRRPVCWSSKEGRYVTSCKSCRSVPLPRLLRHSFTLNSQLERLHVNCGELPGKLCKERLRRDCSFETFGKDKCAILDFRIYWYWSILDIYLYMLISKCLFLLVKNSCTISILNTFSFERHNISVSYRL